MFFLRPLISLIGTTEMTWRILSEIRSVRVGKGGYGIFPLGGGGHPLPRSPLRRIGLLCQLWSFKLPKKLQHQMTV